MVEVSRATMEQFVQYFGTGLRIVAMHPEGGPHTLCGSIDNAIALNGQGFNLYFTANPATGAGVQGLTSIRYVYTDIDPAEGVDPAQVADTMHAAGATVYGSGRGQVGMLRLSRDHPVGDYQLAQVVNRGLAAHYGGDKQVNSPAHLLKLPGSYAWMSATKLAAGYHHTVTGGLRTVEAPVDLDALLGFFGGAAIAQMDLTHTDHAGPTDLSIAANRAGRVTDAIDMSAIFAQMLKDVADMTTNEVAAKEAIFSTPFVVHGRGTAKGTREEKCERVWRTEWTKALLATEGTRASRAHGRTLWNSLTHVAGAPVRAGWYNDDEEPVRPQHPEAGSTTTTKIPGLLGSLTDYLYHSARHPIWEVALATALTHLAGITGRVYRTPEDASLGMYTMLILPSGVGKSGGATGWGLILRELAAGGVSPHVLGMFEGPGSIVSAAGVHKSLEEQPSAYWILRDGSSLLQAMGSRSTNERFQTLLTAMLDLYASRSHQLIGKTRRSKAEDSTAGSKGPNMALMIDTQPEPFAASLDRELVAKGLISRMLCMRYEGDRPFARRSLPPAPPVQLIADLKALFLLCAESNALGRVTRVPFGEQTAADTLYTLDDKYNVRINKDKLNSGPWTRASLKIEQLATLIAVCRDPHNPAILTSDVEFGRRLVEPDSEHMYSLLSDGGIGQGADVRENRVIQLMRNYSKLTAAQRKDQKVPVLVTEFGFVVPLRYLVKRLSSTTPFLDKAERDTPAEIVEKTLRGLVRAGSLREVPAAEVQQRCMAARPEYKIRNALEQPFYQLTDWSPDFTA
jgi:hypothetical protein